MAAANNRPYFFFFSSTYRELYLQNMLNVLALPFDAIGRVRYDDRLVVDELLPDPSNTARTTNNKKPFADYKGACGLVVLVTQTETPEGIKVVYYPLREAEITSITWEGDVLFCYFEVKRYVDWRGASRELLLQW